MSKRKPLAVLISDVHFSLKTLDRASAAFLKAQFKAALLNVPLVVAGDLLDTKANMRAEWVNKLIQLMSVKDAPETIILCGNHDLCNEKGKEHALNFLKPYATVIDLIQTNRIGDTLVTMFPYQSDPQVIKTVLDDADSALGEIFIMHQGVTGSKSGEYLFDKTAVPKEWFRGRRVISGHYHPRQTIALPDGGQWDFLGNPYSLGHGEAGDPEKGFSVLYTDRSLEFIPVDLPAHKIVHIQVANHGMYVENPVGWSNKDILKVVVSGPSDELMLIDKETISNLVLVKDFQLEFEPTENEAQQQEIKQQSSQEVFDEVIDSSTMEAERKERLKKLWRQLA